MWDAWIASDGSGHGRTTAAFHDSTVWVRAEEEER
jgi:hypothetical protein